MLQKFFDWLDTQPKLVGIVLGAPVMIMTILTAIYAITFTAGFFAAVGIMVSYVKSWEDFNVLWGLYFVMIIFGPLCIIVDGAIQGE